MDVGLHDGHRDRLRRRFNDHGLENFSDHEVLELLLTFVIPRRDVNPLAHQLIQRFGGLEEVLCAPMEELQDVPGMGERSATLLRLIYPAYKAARLSAARREHILNSTEKVGTYFLSLFAGVQEERVYQLCLDIKGRLLSSRLLGAGTVNEVTFSTRQIVENALRTKASLVVLGHNHPSGVALPSPADITATRLADEALRTVGIRLMDHIVVADEDFVSMVESGVLD